MRRAAELTRPVLQVIIGSTRPGRVGPAVASWFAAVAEARGCFTVEVVDVADYDLPLMDEPHHPKLHHYVHDHTHRWSRKIQEADAFVFVHPEYNYGFNAAIKNALDYLHDEWQHKTISFVSYGGVSGGLRATQMLKQVVSAVGLVPVTAAVSIPFVASRINPSGTFEATETMESSAQEALQQLFAMTTALAALRRTVGGEVVHG